MYDSNYPSNKKGSTNIDDTTYLQRSPYGHSSSFLNRSPNRSTIPLNDRLSETRRSIEEIIQQVSAKKSLNQQALEQVKNVNHEVVSSLSGYYPTKSAHQEQRNRTAEHHRADSRDIVVTSQFQWRPQGSQEDFRRSERETVISHENLELRSRLNEEMRRNNELMKYARSLETENATLRSSRNVEANNQSYNSLLEENRYLRNQLAQSQLHYGSIDLVEELRLLKQENNKLRKDTITLLKEKSSYM